MQSKAKKIFIADDDPDIVEIISMMLQTQGYTTAATNNATDIFAYKPEELPDLILLDIWMSGIDGREICEQLKGDNLTKNIPVLFISANSNIEEISAAYNADGYIAKPFEMSELLKKVHGILFNADSLAL